MRHRNSNLRLGKKQDVSWSITRNMVTSVLLYESIRTTRKRAKVIQPMIDHLIAKAKRMPEAQAIRAINEVVTDKNACRKVIEVLKARYANRPGGFTQMVPAGARKGDGAELVDLSLMDRSVAEPKEEKKEKVAAAKKPTKKAATAAA